MKEREDRERHQRIRERAYRLWQQEGSPEGRADVHWDQAAELVAIEENHELAMEKVPTADELGPTGEPIEPIEALENTGEFPTTTDQGEQMNPRRRATPDAKPLRSSAASKAVAPKAAAAKAASPTSTAKPSGSKGRAAKP